MKLAIVTLSQPGALVAQKIARWGNGVVFLHDSVDYTADWYRFSSLRTITGDLFEDFEGIVFVAPCGAVVRSIAPHLRHKLCDPAVVVVDVLGRWAVSLLSGHEGGANTLAVRISNVLGCEPVITTTSDAIKNLLVGVGCRRGTSEQAIIAAVGFALAQMGATLSQVRYLASVDIKADEAGLKKAADELQLPLRLIASDEIRSCRRDFHHSAIPKRNIGLPAVAEPAALLAGRRTTLVLSKQIINGVTVAIAQEDSLWLESDQETNWIEPIVQNR